MEKLLDEGKEYSNNLREATHWPGFSQRTTELKPKSLDMYRALYSGSVSGSPDVGQRLYLQPILLSNDS